jgi:hypothetical protein
MKSIAHEHIVIQQIAYRYYYTPFQVFHLHLVDFVTWDITEYLSKEI